MINYHGNRIGIDYIKSLLALFIFVLRQTRYEMPQGTKLALYYSHVNSHLSYMSAIWGYGNISNTRRLQKIQNKAIRNLFWQQYRNPQTRTETLYRTNQILKVNQMIKYNSLTLIHQLRHELIRNHIHLHIFSDLHEYDTRRRNDFVIPLARRNILHNSSLVYGLSQYNVLPNNIKQETRIKNFKIQLKRHLLEES